MAAKNVLIVLLHGIGDCLMALPAIEALKQQSPAAKITVMTIHNPAYHQLLKHVPFIDRLLFSTLPFNPHYGNPLRFWREKRIINQDIRRASEHDRFTDVFFISMFRTPVKLYAHLPFPGYKEHKSFRTARELGVTLSKHPRYTITYGKNDRQWVLRFLQEKKLSRKKLICLHFTGSSPQKSLPFNDGQKIMQYLHEQGYHLLLLHDKKSYEREQQHYDPSLVTTHISDNILRTAALIDQSYAFIGIDSGLAHIAASLNRKTFVIYFREIWRYNSLALGDDVHPYIYRKEGENLLKEVKLFFEQA